MLPPPELRASFWSPRPDDNQAAGRFEESAGSKSRILLQLAKLHDFNICRTRLLDGQIVKGEVDNVLGQFWHRQIMASLDRACRGGKGMAGTTGLEPATSDVRGRRSATD